MRGGQTGREVNELAGPHSTQKRLISKGLKTSWRDGVRGTGRKGVCGP